MSTNPLYCLPRRNEMKAGKDYHGWGGWTHSSQKATEGAAG